MRGLKSPLNYPVSDVKVWGRNITHGLYDQGNIGLIPHFDVETLCKYITIKNYTMEIDMLVLFQSSERTASYMPKKSVSNRWSIGIMNKRQKIVGIVSLAILAIINFVIYGLSDMQTIYKGHPSVERVLSDSHDALLNIGYLVLANYLIIVFLFICLWRKGGKR